MKVSISWWLLQLTVIILAIWRITVNRVLKISWVNCDKKRAQIQRGRSRNTEQILAVKFPKSCGDDRWGNYAMTWIWKHPRSYFHSYKFHISYVKFLYIYQRWQNKRTINLFVTRYLHLLWRAVRWNAFFQYNPAVFLWYVNFKDFIN